MYLHSSWIEGGSEARLDDISFTPTTGTSLFHFLLKLKDLPGSVAAMVLKIYTSFVFINLRRHFTLCTNSSIFSMAWWAWSGKVRTSPTSSSSSSSSASIAAPFREITRERWSYEARTVFPCKSTENSPTSAWVPLDAAGRPPPSSSSGPSSISSTSGTRQSSEIRQSASLADPFRPDIGRLPDDPLTVSVFSFRWDRWFTFLLRNQNHS